MRIFQIWPRLFRKGFQEGENIEIVTRVRQSWTSVTFENIQRIDELFRKDRRVSVHDKAETFHIHIFDEMLRKVVTRHNFISKFKKVNSKSFLRAPKKMVCRKLMKFCFNKKVYLIDLWIPIQISKTITVSVPADVIWEHFEQSQKIH